MRAELQSLRYWLAWITTGLAVGLLGCPSTEPKAADREGREPAPESRRSKGVVVDQVDEGSSLAVAGLQPGDVIFAWERLPNPPANPEMERGELETVFDWMWLEVEQSPRGTVRILGEREGEQRSFEVAMGKWAGKVRPHLPRQRLEVYKQGRQKIEAGEIEQGVELWNRLTQLEEEKSDGPTRSWILLRIAEAYAETGAWEQSVGTYLAALEQVQAPAAEVTIFYRIGKIQERQSKFDQAEASHRSALEIARATWGRSLNTANAENGLGSVAWYRGRFELASNHFEAALEIREKLAPDSLALANSLNYLGNVAGARGQLELASAHHQRALEIKERLAPDSLDLARSLSNLGNVAKARGRLERASVYYQRSLEIRKKLAPDSHELASSLHNLGLVALDRGQLELASAYHQRALEIIEKWAPDSVFLTYCLNSLGNVAWNRGQLERATDYYQRALEIIERLAPDSLDLARSLNTLGNVALARGQSELASTYHQRGLEIRERLAPDSLDLARSLNDLGRVALGHGRLELANTYHQRSLEITEKLAPESLILAASLGYMGNVALERGQLELAGAYFQRALEITEKWTPESIDLADCLFDLGTLAEARGQLELANEYYQRSLEITEKLDPEHINLIEILSRLGEISRSRGDIKRAADLFLRAIHVLETQISNLGASHDVKASLRALHGECYRSSIESLLQLHRPDTAFATMESSRARAFLALLNERDLIFSDVPEDLDRERRRLAFLYEDTQNEIGALNPRDHPEQIDQLTSRLRELRYQQDENSDKIRRVSPKFAALRYPEPLDLEGVRKALDPGTLMLSYSIGAEQTTLFALTREGPLQAHSLDIGEELLREQLGRFATRVHGESWTRSSRSRLEIARWLYDTLIEPAATVIENSDRLLIVPEGPLYHLPFAALVRDGAIDAPQGEEDRDWHYLVEWKPLHTVLSGSVYAELRKLRRPPALPTTPTSTTLVAFGDPVYPKALTQVDDVERGTIADVDVRDVTRRHDLRPLPHTRSEIRAVADHFGSEPVRIYLGQEATEERAKALGRDVRIVHFATHGLIDDQFPLSSSLALTLPEEFSEDRENGLLQVWEIFERVRLDADLVVLSACRTALGEERFGEGLIGLSRAFQYAGARSVLATLWSVADHTTAELMSRFYRHLRSGESKDEALRSAQLELIRGEVKTERGGVARAPFYWAAFQIIGDWQ